ncbi:ECF transporter S component [Lachnospiraceae bacterium JLR.KK008]
MKNKKAFQIACTGLMAALSYVVFTFFQIKITLPGGDATSIHLGNAICVLGALILGGFYGGLGGAIGMAIGDLFDPVYVIYVPKTLILKFCIGIISGFVAHRLGHITYSSDRTHIFRWTVLSGAAGLLFNAVFDPLFGYFYKLLILGKPAAELVLAYNIASSALNAVTSLIVAVILYMALMPALKKAGLFIHIGE